jgi:hypothetical protein
VISEEIRRIRQRAERNYDTEAEEVFTLLAYIDRLERALSFAACTIKSGEPWTDTCEREIGGVLGE